MYVLIMPNKKGVKPSVTRLTSGYRQVTLHQQAKNSPHPIGVNFQSACSRYRILAVFKRKRTRAKSSISIFIKNERNAAEIYDL